MTGSNREELDGVLRDAVDAIVAESPDAQRAAAASDRVRALLEANRAGTGNGTSELDPKRTSLTLGSDASYQKLVPAYLDGTLGAARVLLFEEQVRQSVSLRRALEEARNEKLPVAQGMAAAANNRRFGSPWMYALAAGFALFAVLVGVVPQLPAMDQAQLARLESVDGALYTLTGGSLVAVQPGDWLDGRQVVRTGKDTSAMLVLDDGSRVEVGSRAQLSLLRRFGGNRIEVERGDIIVEASEQGSGTLDVLTDELIVSVTGTVFEVGHGTGGSVVSVLEGEVAVAHLGIIHSLFPGDQMGSRAGLDSEGIEARVAWSQNADNYIAMLREFRVLEVELATALAATPRYSTRLLQLMPAETVVYIAVPNAPEKISEVYGVLQQRLGESGHLQALWDDFESADQRAHIDAVMSWLADIGSSLGDETVVTLQLDPGEGGGGDDSGHAVPLVLSEVDPAGFVASFERVKAEAALDRSDQSGDGAGHVMNIRLVDSPDAAIDGDLSVWLDGDLLFASTSRDVLMQASSRVHGATARSHDAFVLALRGAYERGAEFLGAVNFVAMQAHTSLLPAQAALTGLDAAQHLVVERKSDGSAVVVAQVHFDGPRTGMAGWIAAPGPMGALDYFSVDTTIATAAVFEDPVLMFDEMMAVARAAAGDDSAAVNGVDGIAGLSVRDDIAAALGGEFALGLDGPALPVPAWKIVLEVFDSQRLQYAIEAMLDHANAAAAASGQDLQVGLTPVDFAGLESYAITITGQPSGQQGVSLQYVYVDGYLVAAPDAGLLRRAIDTRTSGSTLVTSTAFQDLLPRDGHLNFSGVAFNRVAELIGGMMNKLPAGMASDQQQALAEIVGSGGPSLYVVYGNDDNLRFVANGSDELPLSISHLMGLPAMLESFRPSLPGDLIEDD